MLGKLLKYEIKGTLRYFLPIWIITLALTIVNKIVLIIGLNNKTISQSRIWWVISRTTFTGYVLIIMATFIAAFIIAILRFYRNFLSEEGYLTFTLPVKISDLIWSKLIITFMWMVVSTIVTVLSITILFAEPGMIKHLRETWSECLNFFSAYKIQYALYIIEILAIVILIYIRQILQIYASIAIGQLWKTHKIVGSFISYFVIQFSLEIISGFISLPFIFSSLKQNVYTIEEGIESFTKIAQKVFLVSGIYSLIICIAFFVIIHIIFKKKLNLE